MERLTLKIDGLTKAAKKTKVSAIARPVVLVVALSV
jgi:hypothetical protein